MRDLINIIDEAVLFENWKKNRAALIKELTDLFTSLGIVTYNIGGGDSFGGLSIDIERKLWRNGKIWYKITIYLHNYQDDELHKVIKAKLRRTEKRKKYIIRGLSGQIQNIIIKYIPDWNFRRYAAKYGYQIDIVGWVDISEHLSV